MSRTFLDYFEPIQGVKFISDISNNYKIYYEGHDPHNFFKQNLQNLKILPYIQKILKKKLNIIGRDYINYAKSINAYLKDELFLNFIDKKVNINQNIYIATDNPETYNKFKDKYSGRVKFDYHNSNNDSLRKTSLLDAIVDIYMCVYSKQFIGSCQSSFTHQIDYIREYNKRSALKIKHGQM